MTIHTFTVPGRARPQGDLRIGRKESGRVNLYHAPSVKSWRRDVGVIARSNIGVPLEGAVTIEVAFVFARSDGSGPHATTPDLDKLIRAILDALTGIAYHDDKQVACVVGRKRWGSEEGVQITVGPWDRLSVVTYREEVPIGV